MKSRVYSVKHYVLARAVNTYPATVLRKQHVKFPNKKNIP
jgi:hypothetical protein